MKYPKILFVLLVLSIVVVSSCKKDDSEPLMAASIELVSGNGQFAIIETSLSEEITIVVLDQYGSPFEGASVNFTITEGSVSNSLATSNQEGKVTTAWTLGSTLATQTLTVTAFKKDGITPLTGSPIQIQATGTAVPPTPRSIELMSGNDQLAYINTELTNGVKVLVKDQYGEVFEGATVNFTSIDGTVSNTTASTNSEGIVETSWTLGATEGQQTLTISAFKEGGTTTLEGGPITLTAFAAPTSLTDVDANNYGVVIIGKQIWMDSNLKTTHYDNAGIQGDAVPHVTDATAWSNLTLADKAYCYYDNDQDSDYGVLYNWAATMNGADASSSNPSNVQGICPTDWHVPSEAEFTELIEFLGGETVAGGKLKEAGNDHWYASNTGATNESGFTALPGGYRRNGDGSFQRAELNDYYFTTTEDASSAIAMSLSFGNTEASLGFQSKPHGMSVRCIMNKE